MLQFDRRQYNSFYYNQRYHYDDQYREKIKQMNRDRYNTLVDVRNTKILQSRERHYKTYVKKEKKPYLIETQKEILKNNIIDIKQGVFTLTFD